MQEHMLNSCPEPCRGLPSPIHKGELSLILDYIPPLWSQYPQRKARLTVKRRQGTTTPPPPHPPAGPECLQLGWVFSLRHLISSQMTVTARIEVSPEQQGHLGSVSSVCKCSFVGSGGVKSVEGVDKISIIGTCRPWLTVHFLISHHILFKLSADLLHLTPHSAAKSYCCVYWGETSQLLSLVLQ